MAETKINEELEKNIFELKKLIARFDMRKKYDESAQETFALMQSFTKAGFKEEQAFEILKIIIGNRIK